MGVRAPGDDPFVRQELIETLYHVLWELVHVFFDHRGLLERPRGADGPRSGAPASSTRSWPSPETDLDAVLADVRSSVLIKSAEIGSCAADPRRQPRRLLAAARAARAASRPAAKLLASATAARPPTRWTWSPTCAPPTRAAPAIDLTEDASILTAIANDVGIEADLPAPGDRLRARGGCAVALSTSGNSRNLIVALAEARKRGMVTVALVGYDGGRSPPTGSPTTSSSPARKHPADPGGAGERLPRLPRADRVGRRVMAAAYPTPLRRRVRVRVTGSFRGSASATCSRLAEELGLAAGCSTTSAGCSSRPKATPRRSTSSSPVSAPRRRRWRRSSRSAPSRRGRRTSGDSNPRLAQPPGALAAVSPTRDLCRVPRQLLDPGDRRYRYRSPTAPTAAEVTIVRGVPTTGRRRRWRASRCANLLGRVREPARPPIPRQPNACPDCPS